MKYLKLFSVCVLLIYTCAILLVCVCVPSSVWELISTCGIYIVCVCVGAVASLTAYIEDNKL
jgi:hypothetical protein